MDLLLEFTRKLGLLDPRGIFLTLVETVLDVLPNADAGWAARWVDNKTLLPEIARGYNDNRSLLAINFQSVEGKTADLLPVRVVLSGVPLRTEVVFAMDYSLQPEDLMRYRQATGGRLPVSTLIVPIGRSEQIIGVLVVDQFSLSEAFEPEERGIGGYPGSTKCPGFGKFEPVCCRRTARAPTPITQPGFQRNFLQLATG